MNHGCAVKGGCRAKSERSVRLFVDGRWYCPTHAPGTADRNCSHSLQSNGRCAFCACAMRPE
jgi:hypothetical protein